MHETPMDSRYILKIYHRDLKMQHKSAATLAAYTKDASDFLVFLESAGLKLEQISSDLLQGYLDQMAFKQNTRRRKLIAIRGLFRALVKDGYLREAEADRSIIPKREEGTPKVLTEGLFQALLEQCADDEDRVKVRNRVLIYLLGWEGLKVSEAHFLDWQDVLMGSDEVFLKIVGERSRKLKLSPSTASALQLLAQLNPDRTGRVFKAYQGKSLRSYYADLSRHGMKFILNELGEAVGIKRLGAEKLRHFAMVRMISAGWAKEKMMHHLGLRRLGNIAKHDARQRSL